MTPKTYYPVVEIDPMAGDLGRCTLVYKT